MILYWILQGDSVEISHGDPKKWRKSGKMSFLKVVIFGYPFFKFQGSKKLLWDATLSRCWFLNDFLNAHPDPWEMKSAYFGRNRAWIHKSQKILSLSNWCSTIEKRLLRSLCCNFSRWWQLKFQFDIAWFFRMGTSHVGFQMQKFLWFCSHLQAAVVLQSAWRRRAAQVRDMPWIFFVKCEWWMDRSHCRFPQKENGTSD